MRKLTLIVPLICLALAAISAHAAHFSCTGSNGIADTVPIGYAFGAQVPPTSGGGGGSGKVTSTLTMQVKLDATYSQLSLLVTNARLMPTCTLTEPASPTIIELTFRTVQVTGIQLLRGPIYNPGRTDTLVQLTFSYQSFTTTQS